MAAASLSTVLAERTVIIKGVTEAHRMVRKRERRAGPYVWLGVFAAVLTFLALVPSLLHLAEVLSWEILGITNLANYFIGG